MTEIREVRIPPVEGELRRPVTDSRVKAALVMLWASAALLTVVNLGAAICLYRTAGEIKAVEGKLERLAEFEARIKARLDQVNNGVQAQFDRQNNDLQGRFGAIYERFGLFEQTLLKADRAASFGDSLTAGQAMPKITDLPPVAEEPEEVIKPFATVESPAPKRPAAKAQPPQPSPAYQRVEAADGKVYYRKVR